MRVLAARAMLEGLKGWFGGQNEEIFPYITVVMLMHGDCCERVFGVIPIGLTETRSHKAMGAASEPMLRIRTLGILSGRKVCGRRAHSCSRLVKVLILEHTR